MMNKNRLLALALCLCLLLSGCSLAQPETEADAAGEDNMVGVLLTFSPLDLFDFEGYWRDNGQTLLSGGLIDASQAAQYQGCMFAEWDEAERCYSFPGLDGCILLCTEEQDEHGSYAKMQSDEVFCDTENNLSYKDSQTSYSFSATVYAVPSGYTAMYLNPLYQTPDGSVYVRGGSGISTSDEEGSGASMSMTLDQTNTYTENGQSQTRAFHCAITMQLAAAPEYADVFWMTAAEGVLRHERYAAGQFPTDLESDSAEFLLLVETAADGSAIRTLYSADDTEQSFGPMMPAETSGLLVRQGCTVSWN